MNDWEKGLVETSIWVLLNVARRISYCRITSVYTFSSSVFHHFILVHIFLTIWKWPTSERSRVPSGYSRTHVNIALNNTSNYHHPEHLIIFCRKKIFSHKDFRPCYSFLTSDVLRYVLCFMSLCFSPHGFALRFQKLTQTFWLQTLTHVCMRHLFTRLLCYFNESTSISPLLAWEFAFYYRLITSFDSHNFSALHKIPFYSRYCE